MIISIRVELSGEVWMNELRVIGANDTKGWAYNLGTSIKFADLMTVNFNMSYTNPYFHRLPERFGSRVETQNWSLSTDLDILKLVPFNMQGSNLRVNYSHTESLGKPLYIPGTDISVAQAEKQLAEVPSGFCNSNSGTIGCFHTDDECYKYIFCIKY